MLLFCDVIATSLVNYNIRIGMWHKQQWNKVRIDKTYQQSSIVTKLCCFCCCCVLILFLLLYIIIMDKYEYEPNNHKIKFKQKVKGNNSTAETLIQNYSIGGSNAPTLRCCCCWCSCFGALYATADNCVTRNSTTTFITHNLNYNINQICAN